MNKPLIVVIGALILVLAFISIHGRSVRRSIIISGSISVLSSFMFLLLSAPDVALAEAAIGSTLSTIVFMVAIKHHRVIYIIYNLKDFSEERIQQVFHDFYRDDRMDVHFISNSHTIKENRMRYRYMDYYIWEETGLNIFVREEDPHSQAIVEALSQEGAQIHVVHALKEEGPSST